MGRDTAIPPTTSSKTTVRDGVSVSEAPPELGLGPGSVVKLPVKHADGPFGSVRPRRHGSKLLRRRLVGLDVGSVVVGWGLGLTLPFFAHVDTNDRGVLALAALGVAVQLIVISSQKLYQARVAARRSAELNGLLRSTVFAVLFTLSVERIFEMWYPTDRILAGAVLSFVLLAGCRSIFTSWLKTRRALGNFARDMIIVGTNQEARGLRELFETHPELGYRITGVVGDITDYESGEWKVPFHGGVSETLDAVVDGAADGVIIATSSINGRELNGLTRELLGHEVHVHLSSGLQGIDLRRLRPLPMAHEPLFYLERPNSSDLQIRMKRLMDIGLASAALVVFSPIMAAAAIAIKLQDGGPVFFIQQRIGRHGKPFKVYKMRTMVTDAEDRLGEVLERLGNGRDDVLFKLDDDPRRTRVGRFLEATSLDELPQLLNVLNGSMSVVGPRPALPSEVAKFDEELLRRFNVPPGVTGLWQVEARDNPSFSAYRRLDLFYVENWTLTLDMVLIFETISSVAMRVLRRGRKS